MRKNIIPGLLLTLAAISLQAQNPKQMPRRAQAINLSERWGNYERSQYFGVRFGLNVSQLMFYGTDVDNNSRAGFNGGLVAGFMLAKSTPIFLETGLLYQGKGAFVNNDRADRVTIRQHFLEIPVLFKYKIHTGVDYLKVQPFFGAFMAFGVSGDTRFYEADPAKYEVDSQGRYKRGTFSNGGLRAFDFGLKMGCGLSVRNFYIELGYSIGLVNAARDSFTDFGYDSFDNSIHTGCFSTTLGLDF